MRLKDRSEKQAAEDEAEPSPNSDARTADCKAG